MILSKLASKWIAGDFEDVIKRAKKASEKGIEPLLDIVGEDYKKISEAYKSVTDYIYLLQLMEKDKIKGSLSIKLTQLGMVRNKEECYENLKAIINEAKKTRTFIWIDMESSKYTKDTIEVYLFALKIYRNLGLVIQANLKRSETDLKLLVTKGCIIRLVKGAYKEDESKAYQRKSKINENFEKLMNILFEKSEHFAIATHDKKLVDKAIELNKKYNKDVEFQFLMGVRNKLKRSLADQGYKVGEYIPFGENWFPYFWRRLMERKSNIFLIFRSLFGG